MSEQRTRLFLVGATRAARSAGAPAYTRWVLRWLAVASGLVVALGFEVLLRAGARMVGIGESPAAPYGVEFLALALAGFVAGHLAARWEVMHAVVAAIGFILLTATITALREATLARQLGPAALPPLDVVQIVFGDVAALTGATLGGWLAVRPTGPPSRGPNR